jgi:diadenosine tetraphosphatase ApaH/serine/threonine PP2A family protein phosphatase
LDPARSFEDQGFGHDIKEFNFLWRYMLVPRTLKDPVAIDILFCQMCSAVTSGRVVVSEAESFRLASLIMQVETGSHDFRLQKHDEADLALYCRLLPWRYLKLHDPLYLQQRVFSLQARFYGMDALEARISALSLIFNSSLFGLEFLRATYCEREELLVDVAVAGEGFYVFRGSGHFSPSHTYASSKTLFMEPSSVWSKGEIRRASKGVLKLSKLDSHKESARLSVTSPWSDLIACYDWSMIASIAADAEGKTLKLGLESETNPTASFHFATPCAAAIASQLQQLKRFHTELGMTSHSEQSLQASRRTSFLDSATVGDSPVLPPEALPVVEGGHFELKDLEGHKEPSSPVSVPASPKYAPTDPALMDFSAHAKLFCFVPGERFEVGVCVKAVEALKLEYMSCCLRRKAAPIELLLRQLDMCMDADITLDSLCLHACNLETSTLEDVSSALEKALCPWDSIEGRPPGWLDGIGLSSLDLSRNALQAGSVKVLCHVFEILRDRLRHVVLSECKISSEKVFATLVDGLLLLDDLESLDISGNGLTDKCGSLLATLLQRSPKLVILNLSRNRLGEKALDLYGKELGPSQLTRLDLSDNRVSVTGCRELCSGIIAAQTITNLDLRNTGLTSKNVEALSSMIAGCNSLLSINLSQNKLKEDFGLGIAGGLKANSSITSLDIRDNLIGNKGFLAICTALKTATNVLTLHVDSNGIDDDCVSACMRTLSYNRGLRRITLLRNKLSLRSMGMLTNLDLSRRLISVSDENFQRTLMSFSMADCIDLAHIEVEEAYSGLHLNFPLNEDSVRCLVEYLRSGKTLSRKYVYQILVESKKILLSQPNVLYLQCTDVDENEKMLTIVGDIHGQFFDLMEMFTVTGEPSQQNRFVFNGDFVDRGSNSVEVVLTLLAYQILYPSSVFLLRGNHECRNINSIYGFEQEIAFKYNDEGLFGLFNEVFQHLPLCAIVNSLALVLHGGLFSQNGIKISDLEKLNRASESEEFGLLADMLWSDPQQIMGRAHSPRGAGILFGPDITKMFLEENGLTLLIRSHEVCKKGYAVEHDGMVITVFSAPNYCGQVGNSGAVVRLESDMIPKFLTFEASKTQGKKKFGSPGLQKLMGYFQ